MAGSASAGSPGNGPVAQAEDYAEFGRRVGPDVVVAIDRVAEGRAGVLRVAGLQINPFHIATTATLLPDQAEGIEAIRRHLEYERRVRSPATAIKLAEDH